MAGWNVAASNRSARFILGKTVTADIVSTFRKQIPGKGGCFVNYGKVRADENDSSITEKQAFVIGTPGAVNVFTGEVIAVVKTPDKREYWVVAPKNAVYYEPDLRFLVSGYIDGVENKDDIIFVCFNEKSCGAVLFTLIDEIFVGIDAVLGKGAVGLYEYGVTVVAGQRTASQYILVEVLYQFAIPFIFAFSVVPLPVLV